MDQAQQAACDAVALAYDAGKGGMRAGREIGYAATVAAEMAAKLRAGEQGEFEQAWRDGWLDELATKVRALEQGIVR